MYQASVQWMRDTLESLIVNLLRETFQEWKAGCDGEAGMGVCAERERSQSDFERQGVRKERSDILGR